MLDGWSAKAGSISVNNRLLIIRLRADSVDLNINGNAQANFHL